ncbi:MAG: MATE family efflux transporter [Clostridia bacterium]|nr:MATE family efflux transporter [Clostridia bacterium]MBQ8369641.1 MATE family efflux transporter [Clostridia bacterium]
MKQTDSTYFGTENIWKLLFRLGPPVMLSQLILALYNIVDSYFIGKYSGDGLTALSVIFPLQLIITALSVGTGVGVNTVMARQYAQGRTDEASKTAGCGTILALITWAVFALLSLAVMRPFVEISATSDAAVEYAVTYGLIVCVGSLATFLEGIWTKVHQASGNMRLPMIAQIAGAAVNIVLDPILIFGMGPVPGMGVAGAAYATVLGQIASAVITGIGGFRMPPAFRELGKYAKSIYRLGYPSIVMQSLYTVYIMVLNIILSGFSDSAVTVLGLYYKMQTFFFLPLTGMHTAIVPILSYNYAAAKFKRCRAILFDSILISAVSMLIGIICFEFFPDSLIRIFSDSAEVLEIGLVAFRLIGLSFVPIVFSLTLPIYFQAIGKPVQSVMLSLTRQIFCLIPIFWLMSLIGLNFTWLAFPLSEIITGTIGMVLYFRHAKTLPKDQ